MKKICITILSILICMVLAIRIYALYKVHYLNLSFYQPSGAVEIVRMELAGITLKGYKKTGLFTVVTDQKSIEKVVDYLNSIQLKYVREGENFDYADGGGSIYFYAVDGTQMGEVIIRGDNYIHNCQNVTTYKTYNKDVSIIKGIENLEL